MQSRCQIKGTMQYLRGCALACLDGATGHWASNRAPDSTRNLLDREIPVFTSRDLR